MGERSACSALHWKRFRFRPCLLLLLLKKRYMVTSGRHFNDRCCFDYGNAESNAGDDGDGTMEAIYFGNDIGWNREGRQPFLQNLTGPWIGADIENGMYGRVLGLFCFPPCLGGGGGTGGLLPVPHCHLRLARTRMSCAF